MADQQTPAHTAPGDAGLRERVPAEAVWARARWTRGDRWRHLLYGARPEPVPSHMGLVEDAEPGRIGICCSGGGIRSAAFNLGALQELGRAGILQNARYLAAVSGGSYIAAAVAMVAKTSVPDHAGDTDDSDPELVTEAHPPFHRGSPEEQYLRNRTSYMAPGGFGKARLAARILFGMAVNLALLTSFLIVVAFGLSLLYRELGAHPHLAEAGPKGFAPSGWRATRWVLGGLVTVLVAMGLAGVLLRVGRDRVRVALETWSLRLLTVTALLALADVLLPWLVAAIANWGVKATQQTMTIAPGSGEAAGGIGGVSGLGVGGSLSALLAAVAFEVRARLRAPTVAQGQARGVARAVRGLAPRLRVGVGLLAAAVLGPLLLFGLLVLALVVMLGPDDLLRFGLAGGSLAAFLALYYRGDLTSWSLHPFYRRRLCTAFALKRVRVHADDPPTLPGQAVERDYDRLELLSQSRVRPGGGFTAKDWPTLIVCAAANVSDPGATPPGRGVTSFTFSPTTMGGPLVGAIDTAGFERALRDCRSARAARRLQRDLTLPAAVAVSGAAISPSMGKMTRWPLRFLLALANVRLGVWVPNPRRLESLRAGRSLYPRPRPLYLLKELLGHNSLNDRFLYVTDGGHYENLGLVELLRRGCTRIHCFDASGGRSLRALGEAISLARSELGVEISIRTEALEPDAQTGFAERCVVRGTVTFPGGATGKLIYARTVMTEDLPFDVHAFHADDADFPHHSTADQLYTDEKFEAYRELGAHAGRAALADPPPIGAATVALPLR